MNGRPPDRGRPPQTRGTGTSARTALMRAARRKAQQGLAALLAPALLIQARHTIGRIPRLDPAAGRAVGTLPGDGSGSIFRLLVIGESTAVGVGAPVHTQALPGHLAAALQCTLRCEVAWSAAGKAGATARRVRTEILAAVPGSDADLVVITVGINDLMRRRPLKVWAADLADLLAAVHAQYPQATVLVAGMPPVHRFPALPQPLRLVLGQRARAMDRVMREVAAATGAVHVGMDESMARDPSLFAADGVHPSPAGYRVWAGDLANAWAATGKTEPWAGRVGTFRSAVEARDLPAITAMLDPAVEFHSPVMVRPYQGRDQVAGLLGVLFQTFEDFRYTADLTELPHDGQGQGRGPARAMAQALVFDAVVRDTHVQGLDLIQFNDAGLVVRLTVMVRPLPAAMTLARAVGKRLDQAAQPT